MGIIEIKGIRAEPGEKVFDFLEVGASSVNMYRIPVAVINGVADGKTLGVLGGIHGTEFAQLCLWVNASMKRLAAA